MKILRIVAVAGMLVMSASFAHEAFADNTSGTGWGAGPGMRRGSGKPGRDIVGLRLETMTRRLNLTADQQAAIKPILEDEGAKFKELRADGKLTRDELKVKIQELREATFAKILPILTPEQQKKHEALRKEALERRNSRGGQGPGPVAPPKE